MIVHYSPLCCETDVAFDTTHKAEAIAESLRRRPIAGVEIFEPRSATLDEIEAVHHSRAGRSMTSSPACEVASTR